VGYQALDANTTGGNTAVGASLLVLTRLVQIMLAVELFIDSTGNKYAVVFYNVCNTTDQQSLLDANVSDNDRQSHLGMPQNTTGSNIAWDGLVRIHPQQCRSWLSCLIANTTGANNTAVGSRALDANTTGTLNNALGVSALGSNTTGSRNVAVGNSSLSSNTTGIDNVAVGTEDSSLGYGALSSNTTGIRKCCNG
jgi:trimeric autotransporter adhesin